MMHTRKQKERINVAYVLAGVVPAGVSVSVDAAEAEAIFDAAREANRRFEYMSNDQIVAYCEGLNETQLNGMVSLVNGRYFENIVAEQTGGTLFEAKNHPGTDMTLDGTEISIKSNDATADSINDVETISPQDLGMDDKELHDRTAEVMDDDIVDAADAIISGTFGFGIMAMLQAAGKTIEEWEELSDHEQTNIRAAWHGSKATGRAAAGTAKSAWSLFKLAGKGLKKTYEAHEEWASNGGYDRLRESRSLEANQATTDVSIENTRILMNNFVKSVKKTVTHTQTLEEMNTRLTEVQAELEALAALPDDEALTDDNISLAASLMSEVTTLKAHIKRVTPTQTVDEMNARLAEISTELQAIQALPDDESLSDTNIDIVSNLAAERTKLNSLIQKQTPAS